MIEYVDGNHTVLLYVRGHNKPWLNVLMKSYYIMAWSRPHKPIKWYITYLLFLVAN